MPRSLSFLPTFLLGMAAVSSSSPRMIGAYTCIKHREYPINFNTHPSSWWDLFISNAWQVMVYKHSHCSLGKLCWLNARLEDVSPIVQLYRAGVTRLIGRDTNSSQGISFGFLNQFVLFFCEWCSCFQLLAYGEIAVYTWLSISQNRIPLGSPHSPPWCPAWGLQLRMADGDDCLEFKERAPLAKAQARSLATPATTNARWVWLILRVHVRSCPSTPLDRQVASFAHERLALNCGHLASKWGTVGVMASTMAHCALHFEMMLKKRLNQPPFDCSRNVKLFLRKHARWASCF